MSVFVPASFLPGITGQLYQQFALVLASSTALSAINALTLTPALCAILLRLPQPPRFFLFRWFNRAFGALIFVFAPVLAWLWVRLVRASP